MSGSQTYETDKAPKHYAAHAAMSLDMLRQHLRNDKLWKILAQREKAYASHRLERMALQREVVRLLQEQTEYKVVDRNDIPTPFLYSYTAGYLFFRMIIRYAFGDTNEDWQGDLIADTTAGNVRYQGQILAEVPGKEKRCRQNLLNAFQKMKLLPQVITVADTYRQLDEATLRVKQAAEELLALGLIPGQCKVCRRLGI